MAAEMTIGPGSEVILHCRILLEDGTVAEDTHGGEPLCLAIGDGSLLARLEQLLLGLSAGSHRAWELPPEQAFGPSDPDNVRELPRERFPDSVDPSPGHLIAFELPDGQQVPGAVLEADAETVKVDFNHPLAGRTIRFEVEIVAVADHGVLSGEKQVAPPGAGGSH
ncbi:MAG TPA: FKBP-type peptidyl-prolyl cis-trans isomerase [Gammaproteobacteria bacterium]